DCPAAPRTGCRHPIAPGKASFQLQSRTPPSKNKLQWKWSKGEVTPKAAYGDPTVAAGYSLCVYDGGGLVMTAGIPVGAGWKPKPTAFAYKSKTGLPDGIVAAQLKEGLVAGKATLQVKGKGALLPMPALQSLASPITVQLSHGTPDCWEAVYSAPF